MWWWCQLNWGFQLGKTSLEDAPPSVAKVVHAMLNSAHEHRRMISWFMDLLRVSITD